MHIEVDQSGKIEFTGQNTVIGFSNGIHSTIYVSSVVKRKVIQKLREQGLSGKTFYIEMFAVVLFYLIKDSVKKIKRIIVDIEYLGHEDKIKEHLINLLHRSGYKVEAQIIQFKYIGKKSAAHNLSLSTFQNKQKANEILTESDILSGIRIKKDRGPK